MGILLQPNVTLGCTLLGLAGPFIPNWIMTGGIYKKEISPVHLSLFLRSILRGNTELQSNQGSQFGFF
ncbi:hypothetical protein [Cyclobacterium xiamenense]|uniref:hypothetical protein n=1 Tax=Cyclobacterium xiamenense TaxID=1297121 RepID=UPI0035CF51A4